MLIICVCRLPFAATKWFRFPIFKTAVVRNTGKENTTERAFCLIVP